MEGHRRRIEQRNAVRFEHLKAASLSFGIARIGLEESADGGKLIPMRIAKRGSDFEHELEASRVQSFGWAEGDIRFRLRAETRATSTFPFKQARSSAYSRSSDPKFFSISTISLRPTVAA
jgi:hypothetical protein